jgi:hypothetical protein
MRMTFATMLSRKGVAPKVAQIAMRHSDIRLTMQTYTDEKLFDVAGVLDLLPQMSHTATTNGGNNGISESTTAEVLVPVLVPTVGHQGHSESSAVTLTGDLGSPVQLSHTAENPEKPSKKARYQAIDNELLEVEPTRFELATSALRTQRSPS